MTNEQAKIELEKHQKKMREEYEEICGLTYYLFTQVDKGKRWLEIHSKGFLERNQTADPDKSANHAFWRDGQNSIFRMIHQHIRDYARMIDDNAKNKDAV